MHVKVLAHRGFSSKYPENSMIAFEEAIKARAHGLEIDVQMSKDGELVVFHDEDLERITGVSGLVMDYTWQELEKMDVGTSFHQSFKGLTIPSLSQVLDLIKRTDTLLNIELKNGIIPYQGLEEKVVELVYSYGLQEKVILSSFNHQSIFKIRQFDKNIKTGILYYAKMYRPFEYAMTIGANALHPYFLTLDQDLLLGSKEMGLIVNTYTVNKVEDMKRLIKTGVHSIITDFPHLLLSLLEKG